MIATVRNRLSSAERSTGASSIGWVLKSDHSCMRRRQSRAPGKSQLARWEAVFILVRLEVPHSAARSGFRVNKQPVDERPIRRLRCRVLLEVAARTVEA